jgi:hypothetical protein
MFIVSASVEVSYRFPDADGSFSAFFLAMLLHQRGLEPGLKAGMPPILGVV